MGTANYNFPYPAGSSQVQVPTDLKALADAVDTQFGTSTVVTNWNTAIKNGFYSGSGATNGPSAASYHGLVTTAGATVIQTLFRQSGTVTDLAIWQRLYTGSTWTAWTRLALGGDTGWLPITALQSGWTAGTTPNAPLARQIGNQVWLTGSLNDSAFTTSSFQQVASLPAGITPPPRTEVFSIPGLIVRQARVLTTGAIEMTSEATSTVAFSLSPIKYLTD